ncbi:2-amino-4-hydroxy-6-hydroxymethyldihydropteridine diphosphokinase [Rhodoferax koreense]|uniref:2-amino-4-hydroxy-6-hydroxymethyldihydropteridine pyrophosphokinase n=1 Tax=Rhodoferax koreensis TaxID=1842727 RepID=A0A1P8JUS1_9BURK|nr:2-amino-4-hydroxy-6-hydroxymethyldihydropteridine diphosphokinase [Rhodoferax koreense]APW37485.1 2-amino-4-hydroxy-6-hydroxymethyldihydropteridine diphosphokinase [Rhodoferax koreense]
MTADRVSVTAYIALGANLGDAQATVRGAMDDIAQLAGTTVCRRSSLYRTAPVDSSGPDYINAVIEVSTRLSAPVLLEKLQKLEHLAGRERPYLNAPRTLDLDILLYGEACVQSPHLSIPHPRMRQRAFVLAPLAEINPNLVQPAALQALSDQKVERIAGTAL